MSRRGRAARAQSAGFRISVRDVLFIGGSALAWWALRDVLGVIAWLIPMVVGHFFLFCNVFRLRPRYELIWAGVFLANVVVWKWSGVYTWWTVLALQTPLTVLLIVAEVRSPSYHGVWSRSAKIHSIEPRPGDESN